MRILRSLAITTLLLCAALAVAQQPVNVSQFGGTATVTGTGASGSGIPRVTVSNDSSIILAAGSATVGKVDILGNAGATMDVAEAGAAAATNSLQVAGVYTSTLPTLTTGQGGTFQLDAKSQALVDLNYVAGSAVSTAATGIIKVGLTDGSGTTLNSTSNALNVFCTGGCSASSTIALVPATSGGLSTKFFVAAASDNSTSLKASAGQVYDVHVYNNAAYPVYLKFQNKASAPTCGTDTNVRVFGVQAGTEFFGHSSDGWAFGTGIAYCLTKGITNADDTAVLISDALVDIGYD